jgi:hypothetical protein
VGDGLATDTHPFPESAWLGCRCAAPLPPQSQ